MKPALFLYHSRADLCGIRRKPVATGSRAALSDMAQGLNRARAKGECYFIAREDLPTYEAHPRFPALSVTP